MLFREICPKRSTDVPVYKNYKKYRQQLSEDFNHRCGYCNDLDWPRKEHFEIDEKTSMIKIGYQTFDILIQLMKIMHYLLL